MTEVGVNRGFPSGVIGNSPQSPAPAVTLSSRLVVVLSILKSPGAQINYGTGKDVSDETIADGKEPLNIKWFGDSFIEVPVRR
ncbi:MAG: uncharacterized protein QOF89_1647 [Acidobacteriota bacterium]|nr:uncharacterized protein [Acidobacteriota bacterium]